MERSLVRPITTKTNDVDKIHPVTSSCLTDAIINFNLAQMFIRPRRWKDGTPREEHVPHVIVPWKRMQLCIHRRLWTLNISNCYLPRHRKFLPTRNYHLPVGQKEIQDPIPCRGRLSIRDISKGISLGSDAEKILCCAV